MAETLGFSDNLELSDRFSGPETGYGFCCVLFLSGKRFNQSSAKSGRDHLLNQNVLLDEDVQYLAGTRTRGRRRYMIESAVNMVERISI